MRIQKFIRHGGFLLVLVGLIFLVLPAAAQDVPINKLTLSESWLNTALRSHIQKEVTDFSIDLQPGQMVIHLSVTGQQGKVNRLALTLVPTVSDGSLTFDATQLTINERDVPLRDNPAVATTTNSVDNYLRKQIGPREVQGIMIDEDRVSITWLGANADDPTVTIRDNLLSLTYTESQINRMPWVTNPTRPNIQTIQVDLQPGQGVITTTRTVEPTNVTYTVIPKVVNGLVTWQVNTEADVEGSAAAAIVTVWRTYFDGVLAENGMIDAVITDDQATFTWDLTALAEAEVGNRVVSYTLNENEINAALDTFKTEKLTDIAVDMQPGIAVINAAGVRESGVSYTASVTLLPTLADGKLTWTITGMTLNGTAIDPVRLQTGTAVTGALTQGLNANRRSYTITDFAITDTQIAVTVQYD